MYGLAVLPKYEVRVSTDPPEIIPSEYGTHQGSVEGFASCYFQWRINLIVLYDCHTYRIGNKNYEGLDEQRSSYKGSYSQKTPSERYARMART